MLRLVLVAPCRRTLEHWAIWVGCGASASVALKIDGAILTLLFLGSSVLTALRLRREEALWSFISSLFTEHGKDMPSVPNVGLIRLSEGAARRADPSCIGCMSEAFLLGAKSEEANSQACKGLRVGEGFSLARLSLAPHSCIVPRGGGLPGRECIRRSWSPPTQKFGAASAAWRTGESSSASDLRNC